MYWLTPGRGFTDATTAIAAGYAGTVVRDGCFVYNSFDHATHQTCLAHYAAGRGVDLTGYRVVAVSWARCCGRNVVDWLGASGLGLVVRSRTTLTNGGDDNQTATDAQEALGRSPTYQLTNPDDRPSRRVQFKAA